jgi:hypothetical protein
VVLDNIQVERLFVVGSHPVFRGKHSRFHYFALLKIEMSSSLTGFTSRLIITYPHKSDSLKNARVGQILPVASDGVTNDKSQFSSRSIFAGSFATGISTV